MRTIFIYLSLILSIQFGFAQSNLLWKSYYCYNEIKDISESPNAIFVASQNALFSSNLTTAAIKTTTTIDGLSGLNITATYHSVAFNKTLIGYENGLIIVINNADGSMKNAVGIIQKQIPGNLKKINHFFENSNMVLVSCDFGIVQFNLNNSEFGDTYFLGATISDYQKVHQTTVFNNAIYAVTVNNGIKKGDLSNPNLNDFSQWTVFDAGYWNGITTINNQLVASNSNNSIYNFVGNTSTLMYLSFEPTKDIRVYDNQLIVTKPSKVLVFNSLLNLTNQIANTSIAITNPPIFNCATMISGKIYIGTQENGVYNTTNGIQFENITPNGPIRNIIFNVKATSSGLWAVYGGYDGEYNPYTFNNFGNVNQYGISKYTENIGWKNIPYSAVLGAKALTRIIENPKNKNQIFITSFFSGLLKVENEVPTFLYNSSNSGLESLATTYSEIRISTPAFDKTGNLWVTNGMINNALKKFRTDGNWQSVPMSPVGPANGGAGGYLDCNYGAVVIDKNNTKWMGSTKFGVIGYNETGNVYKKITYGAGSGNLPSIDVRAIAIDNKNQLWIGTRSGLRVLSSVDTFLTQAQPNATSIIIIDQGIPQELFYEQQITDIVVDGANRKWVSTNNSGVFLVSPNGQKTIYHFTTADSPLPSNSVLDLEIDGETGEVFMATDKGMISFKGVATQASSTFEDAFVYPNPVRPGYDGTVKISGLMDKANVKITDIEGNLVFETTSEGGTIEWDTTAFGKYKVASGVYMIFLSAQDAGETKMKKVMIVR